MSGGIACNKLLAKVGAGMNKPNAQTVIPIRHGPGATCTACVLPCSPDRRFLASLVDIEALWQGLSSCTYLEGTTAVALTQLLQRRAIEGLMEGLPLKKLRNFGGKLGAELEKLGCTTAGHVRPSHLQSCKPVSAVMTQRP